MLEACLFLVLNFLTSSLSRFACVKACLVFCVQRATSIAHTECTLFCKPHFSCIDFALFSMIETRIVFYEQNLPYFLCTRVCLVLLGHSPSLFACHIFSCAEPTSFWCLWVSSFCKQKVHLDLCVVFFCELSLPRFRARSLSHVLWEEPSWLFLHLGSLCSACVEFALFCLNLDRLSLGARSLHRFAPTEQDFREFFCWEFRKMLQDLWVWS